MVKALRSCLEAAKGKIKAGHLILRKSPKRTATGSSTASNISRIPIRHAGSTACYSGNIGIYDEPGDCQLLAKSLFEGRLYRMPQSCPKQRLEGYIIPLSSVLGPIPQGLHKRFHKR